MSLSISAQNRMTIATVKTRSLAMGGAFTSIQDELAALDFNPACFYLGESSGIQGIVYINGLTPVLAIQNWSRITGLDGMTAWMIRGAAFKIGRLHMGLLWGEESTGDESRLSRKKLFDSSGLSTMRNASMGFAIHLAPNVSLGITGDWYMREIDGNPDYHLGYRYGLYLATRHNIHVGLFFVDFPKPWKNDRDPLERLFDETLNVGISYSISGRMTVAFDIRNVSDEGKGPFLEPHLGLEFFPWKHIAFRSGYSRENQGGYSTLSVGMGFWNWKAGETGYKIRPFSLETAYILEKTAETKHWFSLGLIVRWQSG
ncbi:MAG TPA: hypothetical protein ENN03_08090 [bacterium]|nr:hypothetical protein [bacterium]